MNIKDFFVLLDAIKIIDKCSPLSNQDILENYSLDKIAFLLKDFSSKDYENLLEFILNEYKKTFNKKLIVVFFDFFAYTVSEKSYVIFYNFLDTIRKDYPKYDNLLLSYQKFIINKYLMFIKFNKHNIYESIMLEALKILNELNIKENQDEFNLFIQEFELNRVFNKNDFYTLSTYFDNNFSSINSPALDYLNGNKTALETYKQNVNICTTQQQYYLAQLTYTFTRELYQTKNYYNSKIKKEYMNQFIKKVKNITNEYINHIDDRFNFASFRLISIINVIWILDILLNKDDDEKVKILIDELLEKHTFLISKNVHTVSIPCFSREIKNVVEIENLLSLFNYFGDYEKYCQKQKYLTLVSSFTQFLAFVYSDKDHIFNGQYNNIDYFQLLETSVVFAESSIFEMSGLSIHGKKMKMINKKFVNKMWESLNSDLNNKDFHLKFDYMAYDI